MSEELLLKWKNHYSNFVEVFSELLQYNLYVDVTLVCSGEAFQCHKVVLAACSPLFHKILFDNPCKHPVIIFSDILSKNMKSLLKFIYNGEVNMIQDDLQDFLKSAENLQIKGLAEEPSEENACKRRKKRDKKRKVADDNCVNFMGNKKWCSKMNTTENEEFYLSSHSNKVITSKQLPLIKKSAIKECFTPLDQNISDEFLSSDRNSYSSCAKIQSSICNSTLPCVVNLSTSHPVDSFNNLEGSCKSKALHHSVENVSSVCSGDFSIKLLRNNMSRLKNNIEENYENLNILNAAGKIRGGRKSCCFCSKTFCDSYTLRRHMTTHISKQRQFVCSYCSAAYSRKDHLMAHVRRKHDSINYELSYKLSDLDVFNNPSFLHSIEPKENAASKS